MNNIIFSPHPPEHWKKLCIEEGNFFHSTNWQNLLERAFNTQTLYGWNTDTNSGLALTVFKKGPFRIAYTGFPIGEYLGSENFINNENINMLKESLDRYAHFVRITSSAFSEKLDINLQKTYIIETAITDLQSWNLTDNRKFRRNVRKSEKSNITITDISDIKYCKQLYDLYSKTVIRNKGSIRYNHEYFNALIDLSKNNSNLRCLGIILKDRLAGFLVIALSGDKAYYLHGAMDSSLRAHGGSASLFYHAIKWAKHRNKTCFNFMASPENQTSLIQYKEKMGGTTKESFVYDLPINNFYAKTFKTCLLIQKQIKKLSF